MHKGLLRLLTLHLCLLPVAALAQDICTGILSYASRDVTSESRQNSVAREIYNQHCQGDQASSSSNTTVGLEAVVKAIPIKFNFGGSSTSERLSNFCKTYNDNLATFASESIDRSIVVRDALNAFNECISLASKDIYFSPRIGRTQIAIDVRRGSANATIQGINYDADVLSCHLPSANNTGTVEEASESTVRQLDGDFLPIVCERLPEEDANGTKSYPSLEITIATSRGSLLLPIAGDALLPKQWASEIASRTEDLEKLPGMLTAAEGRIIQLEAYIANLKQVSGLNTIKGTDPSVAQNGGSVPGLSGTYSPDAVFVTCPPGSFVAAMQGFVRGGAISQMRYWCRSVP